MSPRSCPACRTPMEAGQVVERGASVRRRPVWVAEPAAPDTEGEFRVSRRDPFPVVAYRCPSCGRLEWVAE